MTIMAIEMVIIVVCKVLYIVSTSYSFKENVMGVPGAWLPVEIYISNIWRCRKEDDDLSQNFVRGKTLSIDGVDSRTDLMFQSCPKIEFPQVHECYATCQEAYLLNLSPWRNLIFGCANAHSVDPERVRTILTKLPLNLDSKGDVFILNMKDDVLHTPHK